MMSEEITYPLQVKFPIKGGERSMLLKYQDRIAGNNNVFILMYIY